jgi:endonuclease G, mitochondrial
MRPSLKAVLLAALPFVAAGGTPWDDSPVYAGIPRVENWWQRVNTRVLENPGFVVGYSERKRQPLWVAYQARSVRGKNLPPRPERFSVDPRVRNRAKPGDYRDPGYDRGHLAPNYIIGKLYGSEAQQATFLMTNVSPQTPRLNRLLWQRLEEAEADIVAPHARRLWVVTGPVFGERSAHMDSGIRIPEAFYRIWLRVTKQGEPLAIAFIMPQEVCGDEPLSRFVVSVDEVQRRTGLDFFHELDDALEHRMERSSGTAGWRIERFERREARYGAAFAEEPCPYAPAPAE